MKNITFQFLFLLALTINGEAQQLDSLKYEYGYLYFHHYGKGETILLLSGGPGNDCHQIEDVAVKLSKSYHVILLEQRGTGLSKPVPFDSTTINLKASFADINLLLDHLKLSQVILCGHSFGGSLAMFFASIYPQRVKSLILIAPGYFALGKEMTQNMADNIYSRLSVNEAKRYDTLKPKVDKKEITTEERSEYRKIIRPTYIYNKQKFDSLSAKINVSVNMDMFDLMMKDSGKFNFDAAKSLSKFNRPIHIISGRQDLLTYVAYELKIARPSIDLNLIERCGHFPMYEQPEAFYSILFKVLAINDHIKF